jgi:transposase
VSSSTSGPGRSSGWSRLLEDAQSKLSVVAADMFGVSGRQMLEALIAGQRDPKALAQLAQGRMRSKLSDLAEALTGHVRAHHGYLLRMMLDRIHTLGAQIDQPGRIEELLAPFAHQVAQLDELPGVGRIGAQELIAEIGMEMGRFPSAGHLVSGPSSRPRPKPRLARPESSSTGKGNPWIGATIGEAAMGAARTTTFLGSRYRRIVKRRGKQRALVAVGNSPLTIAYCLRSDPDAGFVDLGADLHDRLHPQRRTRQLIRELEHLSGKQVTLHDAA